MKLYCKEKVFKTMYILRWYIGSFKYKPRGSLAMLLQLKDCEGEMQELLRNTRYLFNYTRAFIQIETQYERFCYIFSKKRKNPPQTRGR